MVSCLNDPAKAALLCLKLTHIVYDSFFASFSFFLFLSLSFFLSFFLFFLSFLCFLTILCEHSPAEQGFLAPLVGIAPAVLLQL